MSIGINDVREQHARARDRIKLAFHHADCMNTNCDDVERCKHLVREMDRSLSEAMKLLEMATEYEAIRKN